VSEVKRGRRSRNGQVGTGPELDMPDRSFTTTRRQLLYGVAGAGIVSVLVPTIGWTEAAAAQTDASSSTSTRPWTFWISSFDGETLSLTGLQPNGGVIATGLNVPIITQRSPSGSILISADIAGDASSSAHRLVMRSAYDGTILRQILGKTDAVAAGNKVVGHELALAISADGEYAAVLDTAWSTAGQRKALKLGPKAVPGREELVVDLSSATSIEVFDLAGAVPVGHQLLTSGALSQNCGFAGQSVLATWTEPGPAQEVKVLSQSARSVGSAPMHSVSAAGMTPATGLQQSRSGLWAQSVGFDTIQFVNSSLKAGQVRVFPADWGAAKPYPTRLIGIGDSGLLVVNCGIPAAAIVQGNDAHVASAALLANQAGNPRLSMGQWSADASETHLYVADSSPRQGGVWVYELPSLRLVDRWLSSTAFAAVSCSPDGSTIFAIARERPLVFSITPEGRTVAATELPKQPSGIID
jgi:hypothetical protein